MPHQIPTFIHDPEAVLDYGFDFTTWLQAGETITAAVWTLPTVGIGAVTKSLVHPESITDGKCVVWLQGGVDDQNYLAVCHITTSAGRQDDRSLILRVKHR